VGACYLAFDFSAYDYSRLGTVDQFSPSKEQLDWGLFPALLECEAWAIAGPPLAA
jgi:hypothetical protein